MTEYHNPPPNDIPDDAPVQSNERKAAEPITPDTELARNIRLYTELVEAYNQLDNDNSDASLDRFSRAASAILELDVNPVRSHPNPGLLGTYLKAWQKSLEFGEPNLPDGLIPYLHTLMPDSAEPIEPESLEGFSSDTPLEEREWIIDRWMPRGQVTLLAGVGGIGKSLIAMQIAARLATAHGDWMWPTKDGWRPDVPQAAPIPVFYCAWEEDILEFRRRLGVWEREQNQSMPDDMRMTGEQYAHLRFIDMSVHGTIWNGPQGYGARGSPSGAGKRLIETIRATGAERPFIVIDTAAAAFGGNEIVREHVSGFIRGHLGDMTRELGATVLLVHHPAKYAKDDDEAAAGSGDWRNAVRAMMVLMRERKQSKGGKESKQDMPTAMRLTLNKGNYTPRGTQRTVWVEQGDGGIFYATEAPEWIKGAGSD